MGYGGAVSIGAVSRRQLKTLQLAFLTQISKHAVSILMLRLLKSRIFDTFQKYSYHLSLHSFPEWMSEIFFFFFFFVGGACLLANLARKTIKDQN